MADIQHSAITDPNIHEPKGITTASSGQVYVADGGGSGDWLFSSGHAFGELYITEGTTAQTLLNNEGIAILNPTGEWTANGFKNVTLTPANGTITISQAGTYQISFWTSFTTAAISSGASYKFHYAVNNTINPRNIMVSKNTSGADKLHVASFGFADLDQGDVVSVHVGGDTTSDNTNITINEAGFSVLLVDPT